MPDFRRYVAERLRGLEVPAERHLEIVEELAMQLEAVYARARARGASTDQALAEASAEIPDWTALSRTLGELEPPSRTILPEPARRGVMTGIVADLRHAARGIIRRPGFALVATLTLGIGSGAGAAAFAVLDGVLLQPLAFHDPGRLMSVRATVPPAMDETSEVTYPDAVDLAPAPVFDGLAVITQYAAVTTTTDPPQRVEGFAVSPNLLEVLGVAPHLGRAFVAVEGTPGRDRVAMLGHGFWQRLGSPPDVVGATLTLDEVPRTIVGVLPRGFALPIATVPGDVLVPITSESFGTGMREFRGFRAIARLAPGVTREEAGTVVATIGARLAQAYPDSNAGRTFRLYPLKDIVVGSKAAPIWLAAALVGLIVLMAVNNLAHLWLARAAARRRDAAIRRALGASVWRLTRESLVEATLIAGLGAGVGLMVADAMVAALRNAPALSLPRLAEVSVDGWTVAVLVVMGAAAAVVMGVAPAAVSGESATASLRTGHETAGRSAGRLRTAIVVGQTAMAFLLVAAASLLTVSLQRLLAEPTGFESGITTLRISAPAARYRDRATTVAFYRQLLADLQERSGIRQAGFASTLPLAGNSGSTLTIQGREDVPMASRPDVGWQWISPGYLEAMGIRLLRGRLYSWDDLARDTHASLINETLARRMFPDQDPIGQRIYAGPVPATGVPEWHEIIGVVEDVRHLGLEQEPDPRIYDLFGQHWGRTVSLAIASPEAPAAVASLVRGLLAERDPQLAIFALRTTDELVSAAVSFRATLGRLVGLLAGVGVLVALLGLYGLVAFTITERRRELGVRVALGASAGRIQRLVVGYGLRVVAAGLLIGLALALALGRGIESQLYGLTATSVPVLTAAAAALAGAALLPCAVLAARASRVDPTRTLRE